MKVDQIKAPKRTFKTGCLPGLGLYLAIAFPLALLGGTWMDEWGYLIPFLATLGFLASGKLRQGWRWRQTLYRMGLYHKFSFKNWITHVDVEQKRTWQGEELTVELSRNGPTRMTSKVKSMWMVIRPTSPQIPHFLYVERADNKGGWQQRTGDESFDAVIEVDGEELDILLLNQNLRRRLQKWIVALDVRVVTGQLWIPLIYAGGHSKVERHQMMNELLGLACDLGVTDGSHLERLAAAAPKDIPGAAIKQLRAMRANWPDDPLTEATTEALLTDQDPLMRMAAAEEVGDSDVLRALLDTQSLGTVIRSRALWIYKDLVDDDALETVVVDDGIRLAWLKVLYDLKRVVGDLQSVLDAAVSDNPALAQAAIQVLTLVDDPAAEVALLDALDAEEDREIRLAIVEALGKSGTVVAVGRLYPLTEGLLAGSLGRAAEMSIAQIQSRMGDVQAGGLAVVEAVGGELAVTEE